MLFVIKNKIIFIYLEFCQTPFTYNYPKSNDLSLTSGASTQVSHHSISPVLLQQSANWVTASFRSILNQQPVCCQNIHQPTAQNVPMVFHFIRVAMTLMVHRTLHCPVSHCLPHLIFSLVTPFPTRSVLQTLNTPQSQDLCNSSTLFPHLCTWLIPLPTSGLYQIYIIHRVCTKNRFQNSLILPYLVFYTEQAEHIIYFT